MPIKLTGQAGKAQKILKGRGAQLEDAINKATNDGIDSSKVSVKKVKKERSYADEIADKYRRSK